MQAKQSLPQKPRKHAKKTGPKRLDENALWDFALKQLSGRAQSANELKSKLTLRAASPAFVEPVMHKLREYGYTDDEKFSEAFASSRLANDGFGKLRVLRDLRSKRVPANLAEKATARVFADLDEKDLIARYLARKFRSVNLTEYLREDKNLASAFRRLRTAGFSSAAALAALKAHSQREIDWEDPAPESD